MDDMLLFALHLLPLWMVAIIGPVLYQHVGAALDFLKKSHYKSTFDFEKKSKYVDF